MKSKSIFAIATFALVGCTHRAPAPPSPEVVEFRALNDRFQPLCTAQWSKPMQGLVGLKHDEGDESYFDDPRVFASALNFYAAVPIPDEAAGAEIDRRTRASEGPSDFATSHFDEVYSAMYTKCSIFTTYELAKALINSADRLKANAEQRTLLKTSLLRDLRGSPATLIRVLLKAAIYDRALEHGLWAATLKPANEAFRDKVKTQTRDEWDSFMKTVPGPKITNFFKIKGRALQHRFLEQAWVERKMTREFHAEFLKLLPAT